MFLGNRTISMLVRGTIGEMYSNSSSDKLLFRELHKLHALNLLLLAFNKLKVMLRERMTAEAEKQRLERTKSIAVSRSRGAW